MPTESRVTVQGSADVMMSLCGGIAGFSSGFIRKAIGFHMLSSIAMLLAGLLIAVAYSSYRVEKLQS